MTAAAALEYAARGWPVFPTRLIRKPDGTFDKEPCVRWKAGATRDPVTIRGWWQRWPNAVVSLPTGAPSGLVVLDIDVKHGNGFDTLDDLVKSILPDTPMSHTPSGGLHVFFTRTGLEIRNSAGSKGLGVGLDIRGDGGCIVLPSPNSGYRWDQHWNFDTVAPVPAPAWLGHREKPEPRHSNGRARLDPQAILKTACDNIRTAAAGERHDVLNREAFCVMQLAAAGALDHKQAQHELAAAVTGMVFRTGGDRKKAEQDLADAIKDGLNAPPRRARR